MNYNFNELFNNLNYNQYDLSNISLYLIKCYKAEEIFNLLIAEFFKNKEEKKKILILNLTKLILEQSINLDEEYKNGFASNIDILTNYVGLTNNHNVYNFYLTFLNNLYTNNIFSVEFLKKYINIIEEKNNDLNNKFKEKNNKNFKIKEDLEKVINNSVTKEILDQRIEKKRFFRMYKKLLNEYNLIKEKDVPMTEKELNIKEIQEKFKLFEMKFFPYLKINLNIINKLNKEK